MAPQAIYGGVAAVLNIALSILLGRAIGLAGVCWATCIAAGTAGILAHLELRMALREREREWSRG